MLIDYAINVKLNLYKGKILYRLYFITDLLIWTSLLLVYD